ncbi:MAG: phosphoglycerate kinase [archaeon]
MEDFDVRDRTVFLRVDINIPLDPTTLQILDDTRIRGIRDTVSSLSSAKLVLGSHQSRPGRNDFTTLEPHAKRLQRYCSQHVNYVDDVTGPRAREAIRDLESGEILVLDNLRFCAEENIDGPPEQLANTHMVKRLAPLFDLFVNDAFGAAHRSQPSLVGFAEVLPTAAGRLMERELEALNAVISTPERPCIYVLGGAKVEDKVPVIENILKNGKADKILLGGVVGKVFLKAKGINLGPKNEEELAGLEKCVKKAQEILASFSNQIVMPIDLAINKNDKRAEVLIANMPTNESTLDVGEKTATQYANSIGEAKTVVANGPLGVFEKNGFDFGTKTVLEAIGNSEAFTVIGGGHLAGLAEILGIESRFSHVSTAGGAMLSLLAGEKLPVIEALSRAADRGRTKGLPLT